MTTPPSFGLSQSNVDVLDVLDDCVRIIRVTGLKLPTIKGAPITDALDETAKDIRKRIVEAEEFHASVVSLALTLVNEMCLLKTESVESHQLTPDESSRYEADEQVIRLRRESAMEDADLHHRWCPECFDSGLLTPLQTVDLVSYMDMSVLYCTECKDAHVHIPLLVEQHKDFWSRLNL